ncbi:MAG TPA: zf-TFIIB domain-containing protein [Micromonosporaceae bacterium]
MMSLTCPKCHADMRQYERSGVHVDQCTECRGIFLDRGELERLIDADTAWHSTSAPPPPAYQGQGQPGQAYSGQGGYQQPYRQDHGHYHKKRRKSFFEELFD